MIYKPKSFRIEELVPQTVFQLRGEKAWELLDIGLLLDLQEIRDYTGKQITLNDWLWAGGRHNQVLRTTLYYKGEIRFSQHLFGRAADPFILGFDGDESRELVISMKKKNMLKHTTAMEDGDAGEDENGKKKARRNWLHIDTRPTDRVDVNGLFIFKA